MLFATRWKKIVDSEEKGGGQLITEQAGYIPPKQQIEQMMFAGTKLASFRQEYYDLNNGEDDGEIDPTRRPGLDLAEASEMGRNLAIRMKSREKRNEAKKIAQEAAIAAANEKITPPVVAEKAISHT